MPDQSIHPAIPPADQPVEFVLNGQTVTGKKGESIIQVAAREGVYVPHYCWHPALSVAGNCRLCLVEMHMPDPKQPGKMVKNPKPVIACQTPVAAGSHVFTDSQLAKDCQNGMMEFLLVNHPLDCPICDRGGECMLQRYSMEYGSGHSRMQDRKRKFRKPEFDALIDIERNRCIMCTRCVRFCDEVAGDHVMGVFDRGEGNYIGTFGLGPVSNIFSGNVIDICPVGCLTSKPFRFRARVWELTQTQSTGIWDASGPKVTHWTRNGKLYRTTPPSRKQHEVYTVNEDTEEFIDNLTRFGSDFGRHSARWADQRVRFGAALLPAAFSEAVKTAAAGLAKARVAHGAESIAVLVSPRATMEEGYLAGKFARMALGTDNIDWRSGMASTRVADTISKAITAADGDLGKPFDTLLVVNGDLQHQIPVMAMRLKERARILGLPIVMVGHYNDPYFAAEAKHVLTVAPGNTGRALGLLWAVVAGTGDEMAHMAELAKLTGATTSQLEVVVDLLDKAKQGLLVQGLEDCNGMFLEEEVHNAIGLRQALGEGWGYMPAVHDRNAFGLHAVGAQPGRLPAEKAAVVKAWKQQDLAASGGTAAPDLIGAIEEGRVKALVVIGADALDNYADRERILAALEKLEFFVLTDLFSSPYADRAHVFFGSASNLERDGSFCDVQGNLARLAATEAPVGGARPDWETIAGIAKAMGAQGFDHASVEQVFNEMMHLMVPGFRGSFNGLLLPGPGNDISIADPGGARRNTPEYNPGDFRVDGAHFRYSLPEALAPKAFEGGVSVEGTGAHLLVFGHHVQGDDYHLNHASAADVLRVPPYLELSAAEAEALGVDDNQIVQINMPGGASWEAAARVRKAGGPGRGVVYVPAGVGPEALRLRTGLVRVHLEPLDKRGAETPLAAAGMVH